MNLNTIWLALVGKARKGKKGRRKLMDVVEGCCRYRDRQLHNWLCLECTHDTRAAAK